MNKIGNKYIYLRCMSMDMWIVMFCLPMKRVDLFLSDARGTQRPCM